MEEQTSGEGRVAMEERPGRSLEALGDRQQQMWERWADAGCLKDEGEGRLVVSLPVFATP